MSGPSTFLSSLEGCGPEALEAFEAVIRSAGNLDVLPSDALMHEFEERVDLSADCHEIFDLAVNEIATRRMVPDGVVNGSQPDSNGSSSSMRVEAFARIDTEEIDPILRKPPKAARSCLQAFQEFTPA